MSLLTVSREDWTNSGNDQEVKYNWKADSKGTGSKSNLVQIFLFYNTKFLCMQFFIIPDIEAISLHPLLPC